MSIIIKKIVKIVKIPVLVRLEAKRLRVMKLEAKIMKIELTLCYILRCGDFYYNNLIQTQ